jgi:hypothetical protein
MLVERFGDIRGTINISPVVFQRNITNVGMRQRRGVVLMHEARHLQKLAL